jgi:hypothetical protein
MSNIVIRDLQFAETSGRAVTIRLFTGDKFTRGVKDINEDEGYVTLYDPQTHSDPRVGGPTRHVLLNEIAEATVTDMRWRLE